MSQYRRTVLISTASQLINYGVPLVTFPIMVRAFEIATYGIWVEATTFISFLNVFGAYGFGSAIGALIVSNDKSSDDLIYSNGLFVFLLFCGLQSIFTYTIAPILNMIIIRHPIGVEIIRIVAWLILLNGLNWLSSQVFRLRKQPLRGAIFDIALVVVRLGAVISTYYQQDLIFFAKVFVISQAVITVLQFTVAYSGIRITLWSSKIVREIVSSGASLALVSQANWIVMFGDRLILSILKTGTDVAIYSASYQISMILLGLGWPHLYALLPILGERWKAHDLVGLQRAAKSSTRWMAITLIPGIVGLTIIGEPLIKILATKAFDTNGLLIGSISIGIGIDAFSNVLQYIYYTQSRLRTLRQIFIGTALFNIGANLVTIPLWGIYGAGITTLLTFVLNMSLLILHVGMPYKELLDVNVLVWCIGLSALMGIWVMLIVRPDILHLGLAISGAVIIYCAGLLSAKIVSVEEIMILFQRNKPSD